jgi:hypothetical protein
MGRDDLLVPVLEGLAADAGAVFCARRCTRWAAGVGESSEESTLDSEVEEGLEAIDEAGRTSGRPGGGVCTPVLARCALGREAAPGSPWLGDIAAENFNDGMLDLELSKSASGTMRAPFGTTREGPSIDGRTPSSVRDGTIVSEVSSGWGGSSGCS